MQEQHERISKEDTRLPYLVGIRTPHQSDGDGVILMWGECRIS